MELDQDHLNVNEILNTNDELTENLRIEKLKIAEIELKLDKCEAQLRNQEIEISALKLQQLTDKMQIKVLENKNEELQAEINKSSASVDDFLSCDGELIDVKENIGDHSNPPHLLDENSTDSSVIIID